MADVCLIGKNILQLLETTKQTDNVIKELEEGNASMREIEKCINVNENGINFEKQKSNTQKEESKEEVVEERKHPDMDYEMDISQSPAAQEPALEKPISVDQPENLESEWASAKQYKNLKANNNHDYFDSEKDINLTYADKSSNTAVDDYNLKEFYRKRKEIYEGGLRKTNSSS